MLSTKSYLELKQQVKRLCRKSVIELCDDMELNNEEKQLLMYFYDGKSKIATCIDLGFSSTYYSSHMRLLFEKINDYKNTFK